MSIKRNFYSTFIDTMIFIFMTIMMTTVVAFFMNINNDEISVMSIVVSFTLSFIVSRIIMIRYYAKFPVGLTLEGEKITVHKLLRKDKIYIKDIVKISEVSTMSKVTGSVMYVIKYEGNRVLLKNKRYNNLDEFISEIRKKVSSN